jgi:sporulation protein YlmC with PRC-barrel domain
MTEFTIGADASCSDGPCGKLTRLIVDPKTQAVTHLVIGRKHGSERHRLVPIDLVDEAAGEIRLRCTLAEFGKLDPAEEKELLPEEAPEPGIYTASLGRLGGPIPPGELWYAHGASVATEDIVPVGEVDVERGEPVFATDGEIGKIRGLVIDPASHGVTHVLLEEGHLWGRKEVAIPIRSVTRVDDIIRLTIDKQQVQDLPPVDIDHLTT